MTVTSPSPSADGRRDVMGPDGCIIRTEGLTKVYAGSDVHAPSTHLDLEVGPGEIFGLLGPNGAGKTTTAGMLTTRVDPDRRARRRWPASTWSRQPAAGQADPRHRQPAEHARPPADRLGEPLLPRAAVRHPGPRVAPEADRLLEQFQLDEVGHGLRSTPSPGGMAQRLMVARAIFHRPAVLFLDEPTAGLDPQSRLALWEILRDLNAGRPDHPPHHPLHGGGRPALRPGGHHGPGASCSPSTRRTR